MKAFYIVFFYFLFDRELYFVLHSEFLNSIYALLSKVFTVLVLVILLLKHKEIALYKLTFYIMLPFLCMLFSTVLNGGDLERAVMIMYPVFAMGWLLLWKCNTIYEVRYFVKVISNLYFVLAFINFVLLIVSPSLFTDHSLNSGESYFLGLENQVGYPLMKGLCFILIDYGFTNNKKKIFSYLMIHALTLFIIFSGSNLVGFACMMLFLIPNIFQRKISKISLNKLCGIFAVFFVVVILLNNLSFFLESSVVTYVVVDLLGKNLTLSNRTIIWDMVIKGFLESPIYGNGIRETVNLFYISEQYTKGYMSAHNQILQSLYESGILFFILLMPLLNQLSINIKKSIPFVGETFKATVCVLLVMYMGEAPGIDKLLSIVVIGLVITEKCKLSNESYGLPNKNK